MVSTITDLADVSPVTQTALVDAIKAGFQTTLGYTVINDYTVSTTRHLVFQKSLGIGKTYDNVYFQISVTNGLVISQTLHTGWTMPTTGVGSGSASANTTFNSATPISLKTFRSNVGEFDFLIVYQGSISCILGWLRPTTLNNVDENFYNCFVEWNVYSARSFRSVAAAQTLGGVAGGFVTVSADIPSTNHYNKNDIIPRLILYSQGNYVMGITSDDIAFGAGNGLGLFGTVGDWQKVWNGGGANSSIYLK